MNERISLILKVGKTIDYMNVWSLAMYHGHWPCMNLMLYSIAYDHTCLFIS